MKLRLILLLNAFCPKSFLPAVSLGVQYEPDEQSEPPIGERITQVLPLFILPVCYDGCYLLKHSFMPNLLKQHHRLRPDYLLRLYRLELSVPMFIYYPRFYFLLSVVQFSTDDLVGFTLTVYQLILFPPPAAEDQPICLLARFFLRILALFPYASDLFRMFVPRECFPLQLFSPMLFKNRYLPLHFQRQLILAQRLLRFTLPDFPIEWLCLYGYVLHMCRIVLETVHLARKAYRFSFYLYAGYKVKCAFAQLRVYTQTKHRNFHMFLNLANNFQSL